MGFRGSSATLIHGDDLKPPPTGQTANGSPRHSSFESLDIGTRQARVLFDYDAVGTQEISVAKDDVLIVYRLPGLDPDFVMAEKSGKRGRIPISYLELI